MALDEPARNAAERCGWTTIMADALVEASEGDYWAAVDRVSQNWFRPDDHDLTVFNDVSLGNLLFFEFGDSILYSLIRRAYLAQAIVERFAPTHIVVAGASSPEIARVMAAAAPRATVRTVALRSARPLRDMLDPRLLRLTLRRAGVDRVLRALVFRLGNMIRAFPSAPLKTDRGKVFAVVDIPTGSIMDTLAPVVRRLGAERAIVLTTDPRAVSAMRSRGLSTRIFDPGTYRWSGHENRAAHRFVQDCWRTLDARLSRGADAVRCRGLDLWPLMRDASRRLVLRRLPWALRELAAARALLTDVRPSLILTASDAHYAAQIFTVVGARLGIPSLSVQHGTFGQPFGYLPLRASTLAVWGPAIKAWCVENGAPGHRIAVTGQPRFDTLLARSRAVDRDGFLAGVQLATTLPTILFAPESLSSCPELARWMTSQLVAALHDIAEMQVLVRPHPSDSEKQHRGGVPPQLAPRMVVNRQGDVAEALAACDVVVLGQSTLGLEAMIVGRPVIMLLPEGGDRGAVPYAARGAALRATSAETLRIALLEVIRGSDRAAALRAGAQSFIEGHHASPLGGATTNVVALIEQMVADSPRQSGAAA